MLDMCRQHLSGLWHAHPAAACCTYLSCSMVMSCFCDLLCALCAVLTPAPVCCSYTDYKPLPESTEKEIGCRYVEDVGDMVRYSHC